MVPFAGRIRNGQFQFRGQNHALERRATPHAIHGTVDTASWAVASLADDAIAMTCSLGSQWPFDGTVRHTIKVNQSCLRMTLALTAHEAMPAQVGWHPWFTRPALLQAEFTRWLPRGADGLPTAPTSEALPNLAGPVDDCFTGADTVLVETNGVSLSLTSDCSHWVIYTAAEHGVCAEPQSGPPNEIEHSPFVLDAGKTLSRWFEIAWG